MYIAKLLPGSRSTLQTVLDVDNTLTEIEKKLIHQAIGNAGQVRRKLISTKEACEILGVCSMTLRRYEQKGLLTPIRYTPRKIRWDQDEIEAFKNCGITD